LRDVEAEPGRRVSEWERARRESEWFALPPGEAPRWLLPLDPGAARSALAVYHPVTVRARIGWEVVRALSSLGVLRVMAGRGAPPRAVTELVDPYLPVGGSLVVAKTNHAGRFVALILAAGGSPVGLAKIATDNDGRRVLAREAGNLDRLGGLLPSPLSPPRVLGLADGVLVLEAVPWRARWRPWRLPEDVAFALGAFSRTAPPGSVSGTRRGLSHGDFAPWNLLRTPDRWVLVDWEDAREDRPAFYDLMHFLAQSRTLLGRPSTRELADGVTAQVGWVGRAVAAYARGADVSADEAWPQLLAYLRANIDDPDRRRLLEELTHGCG
jgi:Phosphotransferase enzyme family